MSLPETLLQYPLTFIASPWVTALLGLIVVTVMSMLAWAFAMRARIFEPLVELPLVGSFFVASSSVFALVLAFLCAEAWSHGSAAKAAQLAESGAAERIARIAGTHGESGRVVVDALRVYLDEAVTREWIEGRNLYPLAPATAALGTLEQVAMEAIDACVARSIPQPCLEGALADGLIAATTELHEARNRRLATGSGFGDRLRWFLLLTLAFVTLLAVALVHRDRPRTGAIAVGIMAATMVPALVLVALYEFPYGGARPVMPDRLMVLRGTL